MVMKRLRVHREGRNIIIGLVFLLFAINVPIFLYVPHWAFAITLVLTAMLLVFVTYFFRNPVRVLEVDDPNFLIAPADGRVVVIEPTDENEYFTNMFDYLRGRVAGVHVGPDNTIIIRGLNSMQASTEPLILLDGVEITDLNLVNPRDVYSVDVLKDASAAIYGMKGANGVILITTKRHQEPDKK